MLYQLPVCSNSSLAGLEYSLDFMNGKTSQTINEFEFCFFNCTTAISLFFSFYFSYEILMDRRNANI